MARDMRVLAWITEGGWEACVDAVARLDATDVTLLHVATMDVPGPRGPRYEAALARMAGVAAEAAHALLEDAEERLTGRRGLLGAAERVAAAARGDAGLGVRRIAAAGLAEEVVMEAAAEADLLVVARDNRHPGPHSIGHAARFVVDHAPCDVLLAWPGGGPDGPPPKPKPNPKPKPKPKPKPEPH